jgi:Protein of unknown function (DUF3828)
MRLICLLLISAASCLPAFAGEAADAVRYFYDHPDAAFEVDGKRIADPMLEVIKANAANNDEPCIDFSPVMDAQDWDEKEVKDSLKLTEAMDEQTAIVTATFKLFGEERSLDWSMLKAGGVWKVSDIASKTGEWVVSGFECAQ